MPKKYDLAGQDFGLLRAVNAVSSRKEGIMWNCHCECGKFLLVSSERLRKGRVFGCGCDRTKTLMTAKRRAAAVKSWSEERRSALTKRVVTKALRSKKPTKVNSIESGNTYGSLEVQAPAPFQENKAPSQRLWICLCTRKHRGHPCNTMVAVRADKLAYGTTKTCGCGGEVYADRMVAKAEAIRDRIRQARREKLDREPHWRRALFLIRERRIEELEEFREVTAAPESSNDPAHLADSSNSAPIPTSLAAAS